jgi:predicted Zn-dependent protease with MMP-like domain
MFLCRRKSFYSFGNLWNFAERNEVVFRKEVRTTLLHELGHYLGLDEDELIERGLE